MFLFRVIAIVVIGTLSAAIRPGIAQVHPVVDPSAELLRCAKWRPPVRDEPKTWRQLYLIEFDGYGAVPGKTLTPNGLRHVMFDVSSETRKAVVLSNPNAGHIGIPADAVKLVEFTESVDNPPISISSEDGTNSTADTVKYIELSPSTLEGIRTTTRPLTCINVSRDVWEDAASTPTVDRTVRGPASEHPRQSANNKTRPICRIDNLRSMPLLPGTRLKSLQAVGVRNNRTEVEKFDYHPYPENHTYRLGATIDLTNSQGTLIPYEAVDGQNGDLWVSLPGVEESRKNAFAAAKSESLLRILVVGGAAEVAISGLAEVGAELRKTDAGNIRLDIEWDNVGPSGTISDVGYYHSFEELTNAAKGRAVGPPDHLNEEHIQRLLDDFETRLKARSERVETVFWIKGTYLIPSTIPSRLEKFIKTASASEAIAGERRKWFVVVSGATAGFSVNYLKEPIYSLEIGDLYEEKDPPLEEPRRYIGAGEAALLARRLQVAAVQSSPTSGAVTGKLVVRAADIFNERGYVLSPDSIKALQSGLKRVAEPPSNKTVVDLLQSADETSQLRLPRMTLPDWAARKAFGGLTGEEEAWARAFIDQFVAGINAAANLGEQHCRVFFVPDAQLGLYWP